MPPKVGAMRLDRLDDLVGVLGVEADREGVDVGELLEQHRLALHHRHRRLGADVAQARAPRVPSETTATVFALIVYLNAFWRFSAIAGADARDAGRVGHREVVARLERHVQAGVDLAAAVELEGAVGDLDDRAPRAPPGRRAIDLAAVLGARAVDGDLAQRVVAARPRRCRRPRSRRRRA